jgi:hypothetical protein
MRFDSFHQTIHGLEDLYRSTTMVAVVPELDLDFAAPAYFLPPSHS